jgi:calcineurin-like phosphoesterase family protein
MHFVLSRSKIVGYRKNLITYGFWGDMSARPLTFVHLSDIHFVKDVSDVSRYDIDAGLRDAILNDLEQLQTGFEAFDGVLISGDIAFAGKQDEYVRATEWLNKICTVIGCDAGQVWCVPGNHDVDRSIHKTYASITDSHAAIRGSRNLNAALAKRLDNAENGPLLFLPLQAYNEQSALKYYCATTCKQPYWEDTLELNDGSKLRIRGINSAFCSSENDHQTDAPVIVGPMQTVFKREKDVVHLALCHHPPEWIKDGKDLEQALNADARVQLFGHKHFHEHRKINNSVVLSSGAVHPSRTEEDWEPRYYILSLKVNGIGTERQGKRI